MRGKNVFMESLIGHGISHIFGNPGTTESPILDALLDYPQLSYIVTLHEGVAVGAASYYAQATGKPAVVNVHVAPGLGNALGMLYNAFKARVPLVVTAGQQDTRLRLRGPVLGHDLVAMAAPADQVERSGGARRRVRADHAPGAQDRYRPARRTRVRGPAHRRARAGDRAHPAASRSALSRGRARSAGIEEAARLLLRARRPAIVAGDDAASARTELSALAEQLGAAVWCEGIRARQVLPSTHANFRLGLPFDTVGIRKALDGADVVLLVGGPFFEEVWYAPGSPLPEGAIAIQVESAPERLAHNLAVSVGLVGDPRACPVGAPHGHRAGRERRLPRRGGPSP
jgi:benzoylformate decarboxylase